MALRKLVVGNWKMHGVASDIEQVRAIAEAAAGYPKVDVALCVPSVLLERAARAVPGFAIGGQDVHAADKGAHTGNVSAHMLLDAGAKLTIVGHSERRTAHRESSDDVRAKAEQALRCGLGVILCIGESLEEREAGRALAFVTEQLATSLPELGEGSPGLAIAYEPIWAIGTGRVASCDDIEEMHAALRTCLRDRFGAAGDGVRILYGGSVNASNATAIFATPEVDGALVGGASLKAADFIPIIAAASDQS